jgi:Bacteriophage Sf6, terminase small subunit-like
MPAHSTYTPEIGQEIARLMCDETLTLKEACAKVGTPYSTAMRWKDSHPEFEQEILNARAAVADGLYQDIRRVEAGLEDGSIEPDRARTLISSKQWAITKFGPKDWADRKFVENTLNGRVAVEHTRKLVIDTLTEEQLDALEAALKATVLQLDAPKEAN